MAATAFEGPRACPFVALELDRDRRSERPDYRHRCFAEPTPAPRSIAHQESYCLSPGFSACPIFQDWAVRAAAAPVGTPLPAAAAVSAAADEPPADEPPADEPVFAEPEYEPPAAELATAPDEQLLDVAPPLGEPPLFESEPAVSPPSPWEQVSDAQQLSVFDAALAAPDDEPPPPPPPDYVPPPPRPERASVPAALPDEPPVPAFLAGRPARPVSADVAAEDAPRTSRTVAREEIVPSWEIDSRYGAEPAGEPGGGRFDNILTAIAVVAILALGVAGVIFLPGLLAGNPGRTPPPSVVTSPGTSFPASLDVSFPPTIGPATTEPTLAPTLTPEPEGTTRFYRIRAGDTLAKVARRFGITVEDILAANPEIQDPNHIEVGQRIVIPLPAGT